MEGGRNGLERGTAVEMAAILGFRAREDYLKVKRQLGQDVDSLRREIAKDREGQE